MKTLTRIEVSELLERCEWLDKQPCKCAYSKAIVENLPHLSHWFSFSWRSKRKEVGLFYYQVSYGWRLNRRFWKQRLEGLTQSVS